MPANAIAPEHKTYLLAHGAASTSHSGRTLWDHLVGVHQILCNHQAPDYLCVAGLFHSVYGTQAFKRVTVEKTLRHEVQQLIGQQAESLVMAFSELPRPKLFEQYVRNQDSINDLPDWIVTLDTAFNKQQFLQDLLALECANLAEQRVLHEFPWLAQHAQAIGMLDPEGFLV